MNSKIAAFGISVLALFVVATSGVASTDTTWGESTKECRVGVNKFATTQPAGSALDIPIVFESQGHNTSYITFDAADEYECFLFEATDQKGNKVSATIFGGRQQRVWRSGTGETVRKGKPFSRMVRLNRMLDLSVEGKYTVQIGVCFRMPGEEGNAAGFVAWSKPFNITIMQQIPEDMTKPKSGGP